MSFSVHFVKIDLYVYHLSSPLPPTPHPTPILLKEFQDSAPGHFGLSVRSL